MRSILAWTGLWLAAAGLLLAPAAHAQSIPREGSITIYGFAGGINQFMTDVNDELLAEQDFLRENYLLPDYKLFDLTWSLGGGLGFQLMKRVNVAAEYSYQNQDLQNDVFVGPVNFTSGLLNSAGGKCQSVTLNLTWYAPLDEGLFFGAGAGYAWSEMYQTISLRAAGQPEQNYDEDGNWTANGLAAQGYLGYHFNFIWGSTLQVRGGFRYQKMTNVEGSSTYTTFDQVTGAPIVEPIPNLPLGTMDWDYSGFNALIVLGIPFFGHSD